MILIDVLEFRQVLHLGDAVFSKRYVKLLADLLGQSNNGLDRSIGLLSKSKCIRIDRRVRG